MHVVLDRCLWQDIAVYLLVCCGVQLVDSTYCIENISSRYQGAHLLYSVVIVVIVVVMVIMILYAIGPSPGLSCNCCRLASQVHIQPRSQAQWLLPHAQLADSDSVTC